MVISERPAQDDSFATGIQARGLTKRYRNINVVDDLSFSARGGVVTGFLGPNGAGKSTTLRMLLGLARPTRGHISIGGTAVSDLAQPARTIGALLDARAVHPARTAYGPPARIRLRRRSRQETSSGDARFCRPRPIRPSARR